MKLIIGLGNPGPHYDKTRHNMGFMVVDRLASDNASRWSVHKKSGAQITSITLAGEHVLLAKSGTQMNECGRCMGPLVRFYSVVPSNVIALHDELDIEFGLVRLKVGGREGGHNGLRSLTAALGTRDYGRVRLGIGRPPSNQDPAEFVLKPFATRDRDTVERMISNGADAAALFVANGLESAQNIVHTW